jgi:hypothetical protein
MELIPESRIAVVTIHVVMTVNELWEGGAFPYINTRST